MKLFIHILIIFTYFSCSPSDKLERVQPICKIWQEAIGDILPDKYFTKQDSRTKLMGHFINLNLEVCVYKHSNNCYVILEKDSRTSLNEQKKPIKYFNSIYVFENGKISHTSFPQGFDHKITKHNNEIKIHLKYLYRLEFEVELRYKDGVLRMINNGMKKSNI